MTKNEAASVAQLTDEQISRIAMGVEAHHPEVHKVSTAAVRSFARALLAAPAAPASTCTRCDYIGKCDCEIGAAPAAGESGDGRHFSGGNQELPSETMARIRAASAQQDEREALSDEQIDRLWRETYPLGRGFAPLMFARALLTRAAQQVQADAQRVQADAGAVALTQQQRADISRAAGVLEANDSYFEAGKLRSILATAPCDDTAMFEWLIQKQAWIQWENRDGSILQCQVYDQDEGEEYHILSGDGRYFNTPRDAIRAAMSREQSQGRDREGGAV